MSTPPTEIPLVVIYPDLLKDGQALSWYLQKTLAENPYGVLLRLEPVPGEKPV